MNEYMPPVQPGRGPRQPGVGWDEHRDALAGELLHLTLMPVAGVGEHDLGIAQPVRGKLALRVAEHRLEVPEVR